MRIPMVQALIQITHNLHIFIEENNRKIPLRSSKGGSIYRFVRVRGTKVPFILCAAGSATFATGKYITAAIRQYHLQSKYHSS